MTEELKNKIKELHSEDVVIKKLIKEHDAKVASIVEETMKEETVALRTKAALHDEKMASVLREIGVPENFNILEFASILITT